VPTELFEANIKNQEDYSPAQRDACYRKKPIITQVSKACPRAYAPKAHKQQGEYGNMYSAFCGQPSFTTLSFS
jgi:hypothetical protein